MAFCDAVRPSASSWPAADRRGSGGRAACDSPVGWGIVGCGWVARDFAAPAIRDAGRLVGVCDLDLAAAATLAAAAGARSMSLDEMLGDPAVEAVYVATPNSAHPAVVTAAAKAGKAILCEKPLAADLAGAEAMIAAVTKAKAAYATAFDQRFHGAHRQIAALVRSGALGRLTQATVRYACWLPEGFAPVPGHDNWRIDPVRAGGGAVIDLAPHGVDLVATLSGARPIAVQAMLQRAIHGYAAARAVDDGGTVSVRYEGDLLASISVAYNCPDALPRRRLELVGTAGSVVAIDTMGQTAGGSVTLHAIDGRSQTLDIDDDRPPFEVQIEAFGARLRGGTVDEFASPQDDLAAHRLLLGAIDAAQRSMTCP